MHIRPGDRAFLADVASYNDRFNAVRVGQDVKRLHHGFWSDAEILQGEAIKSDWEVPDRLIPFYGDWHYLICLDTDSDRIVAIDDRRQVVANWSSPQAFADSLYSISETKPNGGSGIVDAWLDI